MTRPGGTDPTTERIVLVNPYPWDMPQPKRPGDSWVHVCGGNIVVTRTDGTWNGGADLDDARAQIDAAIRTGALAWVVGHPADGSDEILATLGGAGIHLGPDHPAAADTSPDMTPLMTAAATGDRDRIRRLIIDGAAPDARNAFHHTPLHHAAAAGHGETVDMLLAAGADPDLVDLAGTSARRFALLHGDWRTASRLDLAADTTGWRDALAPTPTGPIDADPDDLAATGSGFPTPLRSGTTELRYDGVTLTMPRRLRRDLTARIAEAPLIAAVPLPHLDLGDYGPGIEQRPWRAVLVHPSGQRRSRSQLEAAHVPTALAEEILRYGDRLLTFEFASAHQMRQVAEMATTITMHGGTAHRSLDAAHTQITAGVGLEGFL